MIRPAIAFAVLAFAAGAPHAQADPYRWRAEYSGSQGGGRNCYFVTLEQCRAAVSGVGGTCNINTFYDGRPITTPDDTVRVRPRSRIY